MVCIDLIQRILCAKETRERELLSPSAGITNENANCSVILNFLSFNSNFIISFGGNWHYVEHKAKVYFALCVRAVPVSFFFFFCFALFERVRYTCLINKIRKENKKSIEHL